jgi:glycosyltransferase involved in cell wall biosynthesis
MASHTSVPSPAGRVLVDMTHCGRRTTGLERIAQELFSPEALAPLPVEAVTARDRYAMVLKQVAGLPATALLDRRAVVLCPGFPPSLPLAALGWRVLPYIHDLFLLTRAGDLNPRARLYMVPAFRRAVRTLPRFLVNSEHTRAELQRFCRPDAEIVLYRPRVRDVFDLAARARTESAPVPGRLELVALGTVEPRKNLPAAAAILTALRGSGFPEARLHVVGRVGWGPDAERLRATPGVVLHGYAERERVRAILADADALISTSHDEGLGLPLLEAQFAGLTVIAPDARVFREVLGESGLLIAPADPAASARRIGAWAQDRAARAEQVGLAARNLARWNGLAEADRRRVLGLIAELAARAARRDPGPLRLSGGMPHGR